MTKMKQCLSRAISCISLILAYFIFTTNAHAGDLYIQSVKAPILSSPSLGSPKIAEGIKGEKLKELEKKGNWYNVDYKGKTGWVSRLLVSNKPPSGNISVLEETEEKLEKGVRKRASAFTTAAAARGFAEERGRMANKYKVDFKGVEFMEALNITDKDALEFLREGVAR